MTVVSFLLSLTILLIIFIVRQEIVNIINMKFNTKLETQTIVYIISVVFIIIITLGMLMGGTEKKFGNIGSGIENLNKQDENARPHPMFDINTYW